MIVKGLPKHADSKRLREHFSVRTLSCVGVSFAVDDDQRAVLRRRLAR